MASSSALNIKRKPSIQGRNYRQPSTTRAVLQSPGKEAGTPKILLEGKWVADNYGFNVGNSYEIIKTPDGNILLKKV